MIFSKKIKNTAFLAIVLCTASATLHADTFTGKIESILTLKNGQSEVVLNKGKERETIVLNSQTEVGSVIPAEKLKAGAIIYLSPETRGGGGGRYKGVKSPFHGIPKNMQKRLGLPNMPEIPGVPGTPSEISNLPQVPKLPKVPKVSMQKSESVGEAAPAEGDSKKSRKPTELPVGEPTEEEKTLYGKVSSDKPLLRSTGDSLKSETPRTLAKKVLSVKAVEGGVEVELEGPDGTKERVTFVANKSIVQALSAAELRKNMQVKAKTVKADQLTIAQKITVVS